MNTMRISNKIQHYNYDGILYLHDYMTRRMCVYKLLDIEDNFRMIYLYYTPIITSLEEYNESNQT